MTFPWEAPAALPMPWEAPAAPAVTCGRGHVSGRHKDGSCVQCRREDGKKWRQSNPDKAAAIGKRNRTKRRASHLIRLARARSAKKGIPFNLSEHVDYYQAVMDAGICELTGLKFEDSGPNVASLDRIEPEKGYVYGNVRVVIWAANAGMGNWGVEKYREIANALQRELKDTVEALQADVRYTVTHTAVLVRATGPQAAALGMLINTRRGQLIPVGEARYSDGHTIQFQDLGMPQPRAPEMSIADLVAALAGTVVKLGLELQP